MPTRTCSYRRTIGYAGRCGKLMEMLADIYVIKRTRSRRLAIEFLDCFIPSRTESQSSYQIPWNSETPHQVFESVEQAMDYFEENPGAYYALYWRNLDQDSKNKHGMIFYTTEGFMIFGISRYANGVDDLSVELECLDEMKKKFNTEVGYVTYECPPEDNYQKFVELVEVFNK